MSALAVASQGKHRDSWGAAWWLHQASLVVLWGHAPEPGRKEHMLLLKALT